jgi:hypothetical protein
MDTMTFQNKIDEHLKEHSGLDQHRDYLGISAIGKCPRQVVRDYLYGKKDLTMQAHQMCYAGYLFERDVMQRLYEIGVANIPALEGQQQTEVVAAFDQRLRGHVDGETVDGDLLEIKSVTRAKFEKVKATHMALTEHFAQVQLYMKYGPWKKCWIVYVCRETMEHHVTKVSYLHTQGIKYEMKAQRLLAHIDSRILPQCECQYCRE